MLFLQVNDAAVTVVSLRLVIFGSKVQLFCTQITDQTGEGGGGLADGNLVRGPN